MPRTHIHPEANVFQLRQALAAAGDRLCIVCDGRNSYLCLPHELPAGCTVIHVTPPRRDALEEPNRRALLALLAAHDAAAAKLLREVAP